MFFLFGANRSFLFCQGVTGWLNQTGESGGGGKTLKFPFLITKHIFLKGKEVRNSEKCRDGEKDGIAGERHYLVLRI